MSFHLNIDKFGQKISIHRIQFPLILRFAITAYNGQGETMNNLIVDLSKPPKGTLPQGYAYVSLSRSRAEKEITILIEFDVSGLQTPHQNRIT